jgi:hypothetical protein
MGEPLEKSCVACGWTLDKEKRCHYTSHLKLFYGASTRGVWSIGSDVILKDRPDEGPKARVEVKTLNYLATHTDIPIPKVLRDWVDRDGRYFVLNERIDGQTLEEAWTSLSEPQKIDVADQVVKVRKQLRSVTSTSISVLIKAHVIQAYYFSILSPVDRFTLTKSSGMLWPLTFTTQGQCHW